MNNYLKFMDGNNATVRSIVEQTKPDSDDLVHIKVTLEEYEEIVRLSIPSEKVFDIHPGIVITYGDTFAIGYCLWRNGIGPFGVVTELGRN